LNSTTFSINNPDCSSLEPHELFATETSFHRTTRSPFHGADRKNRTPISAGKSPFLKAEDHFPGRRSMSPSKFHSAEKSPVAVRGNSNLEPLSPLQSGAARVCREHGPSSLSPHSPSAHQAAKKVSGSHSISRRSSSTTNVMGDLKMSRADSNNQIQSSSWSPENASDWSLSPNPNDRQC